MDWLEIAQLENFNAEPIDWRRVDLLIAGAPALEEVFIYNLIGDNKYEHEIEHVIAMLKDAQVRQTSNASEMAADVKRLIDKDDFYYDNRKYRSTKRITGSFN